MQRGFSQSQDSSDDSQEGSAKRALGLQAVRRARIHRRRRSRGGSCRTGTVATTAAAAAATAARSGRRCSRGHIGAVVAGDGDDARGAGGAGVEGRRRHRRSDGGGLLERGLRAGDAGRAAARVAALRSRLGGGRVVTGAGAGAGRSSLDGADLSAAADLAGSGRGGRDGGRGRGRRVVAAEVEQGGRAQVGADDAEAGAGRVGGRVLQRVPPDVGGVEERAPDVLPVGLGVLDGGDGLANGVAADGVARLGDPDGLAAAAGLGGLGEGVGEQRAALPDGVGHRVLEVRVGVHAEPVAGVDDGLVGPVVPRGPGVDVADGAALERRPGDGVARLLDVARDGVRLGPDVRPGLDPLRRVAVQVLRPDRDPVHEAAQARPVRRDRRLQRVELVRERRVPARRPEAQQQRRLRLDGGRDRRDRITGCSALLENTQTVSRLVLLKGCWPFRPFLFFFFCLLSHHLGRD